jgi:hypothetical protein
VTSNHDDGAAEFLVAAPGQLDDVLTVLDEAAAWLRSREVVQWPSRFEPSWVQSAIRRGEVWLVRVGETISATVTLDLADSVWDGAPGSALYVHRMAVRRGQPLRASTGDPVTAEREVNGNDVLLAFLARHGVSADLSESVG